jgi:hypothetical protein
MEKTQENCCCDWKSRGIMSCVEKRVMWWGKGVVSCRFRGGMFSCRGEEGEIREERIDQVIF